MSNSRPRGGVIAAMVAMLATAGAAGAQQTTGAKKELNDAFRDPDVSRFVERFESDSREVFAKRNEVVDALGLRPGMAVADVGAGTGLYTRLFAEKVGPGGAVFAVDVSPKFLEHIAEVAEREDRPQICTVLGTQASTRLPGASVDLVFICDTYHHFEDPAPILASIHRAIRPGGRLVVVDYDRRDGATPFVMEHIRAPKETFFREIEAAGFEKVELEGAPALSENFIAAFRRVGGSAPGGGRE